MGNAQSAGTQARCAAARGAFPRRAHGVRLRGCKWVKPKEQVVHNPWFWLAAVAASVFVGLSKGGLPAVGLLGVPVLSQVISPVTAAGLLLPVYVLSDMLGLVAYRHAFERRVLVTLLPGATLGVALGWATARLVPEALVTGLVGLIGLAYAARLLLQPEVQGAARASAVLPGTFWGTITGFTSFVSHAGAAPYQIYVIPQRLPKTVYAGTTTIAFAYVNAIKLLPYWALGQFTPDNLRTAAWLTLPAGLAVWAGVRLVRVIPQVLFFRFVTWALALVSVKLLIDAFA